MSRKKSTKRLAKKLTEKELSTREELVKEMEANGLTEEGAKQAATALERVRHDTSEAAAERHNALRYRPVAVPRNT